MDFVCLVCTVSKVTKNVGHDNQDNLSNVDMKMNGLLCPRTNMPCPLA